jgi:hypothetical protein
MKEEQGTAKKSFLKKISPLALVGLALGAVGGYIYYAQVGCVSGTCAITSNPWLSTAWGAAFGYLVFDMFSTRKQTNP